MAVSLERLDALLRLGERVAGAVDADDWTRVSDLLERRARIIDRLAPAPDETDGDVSSSTEAGSSETGVPDRTLRQKRAALADQHETLLARLRERGDAIEAELGQLQQLQHANDSYDDHAASPADGGGHDGVLPPELSG